MMRWILLLVSAASTSLGLLTVFRAPGWMDWRFAVIACGFGYLVAAVPLAAGLLARRLPGARGAVGVATCILGATGFALLVQPCAQGWLIGRDLPRRLERQFGP